MWVAVVDRNRGTSGRDDFTAKVIHTFTKTSDNSTRDEVDIRQTIFTPTGVTLKYEAPDREGLRFFLIDRHTGPVTRNGSYTGRRPLSVDLESLEVSVFPAPLRHTQVGAEDQPCLAAGGHIFTVSGHAGVEVLVRPKQRDGPWQNEFIIKRLPDGLVRKPATLIRYRDGLLVPGSYTTPAGLNWWSIDSTTLRAKLLTPTPLPERHRYNHYAVSAHYGLVAWNVGDRLHQVSIDGVQAAHDSLAATYPMVPEHLRTKHHDAVQAIRRLGGGVDHVFDSPTYLNRPSSIGPPRWDTIAFLDKQWKGGDTGLEHLNNVYGLRVLKLVRADVSDNGLKAIGELHQLARLELIETQATDDGLAHLAGLDGLYDLRIEGTSGGRQFTDTGLKHLVKLPKLRRLTVYGRGFTGAALRYIEAMPNFYQLTLYDTAISADALNELKQAKPSFHWYEPSQ